MRISCIYTIQNLINNKLYVGYTVDFDARVYSHVDTLNNKCHRNSYLQKSWNKYGEEAFEFEILEECPEEFLVALEHYWATILDVHNRSKGYNILPTHPYGINKRMAESSKAKLSKSTKGKIHSAECRKKLSIAHKGKKHSEESKKKMSTSKTGGKLLEEHKTKIGKANKGRKLSQKTKDKISKAHTGKCKSEAHINKMRRPKFGGWLHVDENINIIKEFSDYRDVLTHFGIKRKSFSKRRKMKIKRRVGFILNRREYEEAVVSAKTTKEFEI